MIHSWTATHEMSTWVGSKGLTMIISAEKTRFTSSGGRRIERSIARCSSFTNARHSAGGRRPNAAADPTPPSPRATSPGDPAIAVRARSGDAVLDCDSLLAYKGVLAARGAVLEEAAEEARFGFLSRDLGPVPEIGNGECFWR